LFSKIITFAKTNSVMIEENIDLKPYNTFGISANTKMFAQFSSLEELKSVLAQKQGQELLVLGGGSNILLTQDFQGLVLRNELKGMELVSDDDEFVLIKCAAGEIWHQFVLYCVANNFGGVENLSLIPGSVGASPMQNIGAYGVEIKDVFEKLEAFHIETGEIHTFSKEMCQFGYRESIFKKEKKGQYIITQVYFKLTKNPQINSSYGAIEDVLAAKGISNPSIKEISDAVIEIRSSKLPDPKLIGNAGSFFKNPVVSLETYNKIKSSYATAPSYPIDANTVKIPAGWLIENAGWKGKTFENYGVHKNQALVLVNYGGASGKEIWDLSTAIKEDVFAKFGVDLEREVNVL
jgi:UDP-N-acetylmuramate dehydrogenase